MSRAVFVASPPVTRASTAPKLASPARTEISRIPTPATTAGLRRVGAARRCGIDDFCHDLSPSEKIALRGMLSGVRVRNRHFCGCASSVEPSGAGDSGPNCAFTP